MKIYTAALVVSTLALAGCGTGLYDKPGLTYAEWRRDDAECRRVADGAAGDRAAYTRCMRERGYRLRAD